MFTSFTTSKQKTEAAALPLLAPVAVGVGVYVTGMTMAVLLTAENQKSVVENFQETLPQAKEDWKNFSEATKESMINAYNTYVETGSKYLKLTPSLLEAMQNTFLTSYPTVSGLDSTSTAIGYRQSNTGVNNGYFGLDKGDMYLYLSDGREVRIKKSISIGYGYLKYVDSVRFDNGSSTIFDSPVREGVKIDFSNVNGLASLINTWNSYARDLFITNVSSISLSGSDQNTLTNKDYWDSQIDKILTKDNTGSYVLPIPDTYAYPPLAGSPDLPDKSISLGWNPTTGQWTLPDGTPFEGTPVIETAPPTTVTLEDGTVVTTIPQTAEGVTTNVNVTTGETVTVGTGTPPPPTNKPDRPSKDLEPKDIFKPWLFFMAFVEFFVAIVMYLVRLGEFLLTIPLIPQKPIPPPYGQVVEWFKSMTFGKVNAYDLLLTVATTLFGLTIFRVIRRWFP